MKKISEGIAKLAVLCLLLSTISFLGHAAAQIIPSSDFTDAEVKFAVYPDGTVDLSGSFNHTSTYPNTGPTFQVGVQMDKNDDMHNALMSMTLTVPPEEASKIPFNATKAFLSSEYSDGILNSNMNASIVFPNQFDMFDFSGFPFNSTDFTINVEYSNQTFNGIITIHMVPSLALGDIEVYFEGNTTEIVISDSVTVFYNYTLPIPVFPELNATYVNNLLLYLNTTIPDLIYNFTSGTLTCPTFNTTLTLIDENSAEISFLIIIQGDFIDALAKIMAGAGSLPITGRLPPFPMPNATIIHSMLNATLHSVKSGDLTMSYSRVAKKLDIQASFMQNLEEYQNATTQIMLEIYPPEIKPYIELMLNTTYCSLHSYTETLSYENGQMQYEGDYNFEGDINAQVNHVKNVYIDIITATAPYLGPEWLLTMLKDTDVDISNLRFNLNVGNFSVLWDFEGVKIAPPVDWINATSFRLQKLFNITSILGSYEPPRQNERLKLIVRGGSNVTHTATPFIDLDTVPNPDEFASGNTMIWHNQSISKLKPLIFQVWEGYVEKIYDPAWVTPDNPLIVDAKEVAGCVLNVTSVSESATISIKNITLPPDDYPPPETYKILGSYLQITVDPEDVTVNVTIRMYYTLEQLSALGLDENTLTIFYWNATANKWMPMETYINPEERYAWTVVDRLSIWSLMGQPTPPIWQQPWFLVLMVAIFVVIIIGALIILRKRKQPSQTKETSTQ